MQETTVQATIMRTNEISKPWHKYPLVWMMVLIPFTAVIMGVVMIWLAVDTDDGLVADDYYKLGLEINRVIARDKKAAELGLSAIIEFDNSTQAIKIQFNKGSLESYPNSLPLQLQHATRENSDLTVVLDHGIGDQYIGHVSQPISEGVWYFNISGDSAAGAGWKLNARTHVRSKNRILLQADY
jgi:hypothetical protein